MKERAAQPLPEEAAHTQALRRRLYITALVLVISGALLTNLIAHRPGSLLYNFTNSVTLGWAIVLAGLLLGHLTHRGVEILTYALGVILFIGILLTDTLGWSETPPISFVAAGHLLSLWAFMAFGDRRGLQLSLGFYLLSLLLWGGVAYPVWSAGEWENSVLRGVWCVYIFYYALAPVYMALPLAMATLQRNLSRRRIRELQHLVYVDPLTGLPNRRAFQEALEQAVESGAPGRCGALILLNVNEFSQINDEFGHAAGDFVLRQLSQRWVADGTYGGRLSRVSADEFALICDGADEAAARRCAAELLSRGAEPVDLRGHARSLSLRAGIALFSSETRTPNQINIAADLAQAEARRSSRDIVVYTADLSRQAERRRRVLGALQGALERGELALVYQPIVEIGTGRVVSAEALLRWSSEAVFPPPRTEEFITLAEEAGLMPLLGAWVLSRSLDQLVEWKAQGLLLPHINVNVAPQELQQPGYAQRVLEQLRRRHLSPGELVLELTERTMVEGEATIAQLQSLRAAGVRIAVDDFGTGHSALGQLHLLPITAVKLDRLFTRALGEDRAAERLAGGVLALARSLQLRVVAEGIETVKQLTALTELGCCYGQGYQLSRPLSPQELAQLLAGQGGAPPEDAGGAVAQATS